MFCPYVSITNQHDNSIYILDYKLEIDFGQGFERLKRAYGEVTVGMPDPFVFTTAAGERVEIPKFGEKLIYKKNKPVRYGEYIHGFVMFAAEPARKDQKWKRMRITAIDVFDQEHSLTVGPEVFKKMEWYLFTEIIGAKVETQRPSPSP
jgi:hypothetical protein